MRRRLGVGLLLLVGMAARGEDRFDDTFEERPLPPREVSREEPRRAPVDEGDWGFAPVSGLPGPEEPDDAPARCREFAALPDSAAPAIRRAVELGILWDHELHGGWSPEESCDLSRPVTRKVMAEVVLRLLQRPATCWALGPCGEEAEDLRYRRYREHTPANELFALRDLGLAWFPDDRVLLHHRADRAQLAFALGGLARRLDGSGTLLQRADAVLLEDLPREHPAQENARLAVAAGLFPDMREHLHPEAWVSYGQLGLAVANLADLASRVHAEDPDAPDETKRRRLARRLERTPPDRALIEGVARPARESPRWPPPPPLPSPREPLGYEEDLERTASKYGSLDRVPRRSLEWLARQHGRSVETVRSALAERIPARAPGAGWLTVAPRPPRGLQAIPANVRGLPRFRRPTDGAVMVRIPAARVEIEEQSVALSAFLVDETEVSVGRYARFVEATGHPPPPEFEAQLMHPDLPVTRVSWEDARAFALWVGADLPTECQWLHAARGPEEREYPWGDEWWGYAARHRREIEEQHQRYVRTGHPVFTLDPSAANVALADRGADTSPHALAAWHAPWNPDMPFLDLRGWAEGIELHPNRPPDRIGPDHLTRVRSHPEGSGPYGVFETAGNVQEWVRDLYDAGYLQGLPEQDPPGPPRGTSHVIRGGSVRHTPAQSRASVRRQGAPNRREPFLGFRCAAPAP